MSPEAEAQKFTYYPEMDQSSEPKFYLKDRIRLTEHKVETKI